MKLMKDDEPICFEINGQPIYVYEAITEMETAYPDMKNELSGEYGWLTVKDDEGDLQTIELIDLVDIKSIDELKELVKDYV